MQFVFDGRPPESPLIDMIWTTQSEGSADGDSFMSSATTNWEMVITRQEGAITLTVRGPETHASPAGIPVDAEFLGITFKMGVYMPHLPVSQFVNDGKNMPNAAGKFWLHGAAWEFPTFDNVEVFVNRLVRQELLVRDDVVDAVLNDQPHYWSVRTVRRRFLNATGLTHQAIQQIQRANRAAQMLAQGKPILDTVHELGYFDQPHMTKALRHLVGQTPAQILRLNDTE
jgi:hypothetical protein